MNQQTPHDFRSGSPCSVGTEELLEPELNQETTQQASTSPPDQHAGEEAHRKHKSVGNNCLRNLCFLLVIYLAFDFGRFIATEHPQSTNRVSTHHQRLELSQPELAGLPTILREVDRLRVTVEELGRTEHEKNESMRLVVEELRQSEKVKTECFRVKDIEMEGREACEVSEQLLAIASKREAGTAIVRLARSFGIAPYESCLFAASVPPTKLSFQSRARPVL
ncbi:hypothetical protein P7C70_g7618, partial [Phenoliferia sp. Uapishka_3]